MNENNGGNAEVFTSILSEETGTTEAPASTVETPEVPTKTVETEEETTTTPTTPQETTETVETKTGEETGTGSETPTEQESQFQEIIDGWKQDREQLAVVMREKTDVENQLAQAKAQLQQLGYGDGEEEDEFTGKSAAEIEKIVLERNAKRETEAREAMIAEVKKEIDFFEKTSPIFKANKQAILKVAASFNATNLDQAMKIWAAQKKATGPSTPVKTKEEERRSNAGIGTRTAPGDTTTPSPKGPENDNSFASIYRSEGVK